MHVSRVVQINFFYFFGVIFSFVLYKVWYVCKLPSIILCFLLYYLYFLFVQSLKRSTFQLERWALCERWAWTERSGGRKWTHCERTVNAWKNGKVERFSDSIWYFCIYIVYISFVFFVALIWNIKTNLVHISNAENTHVYEMYNANGKWL